MKMIAEDVSSFCRTIFDEDNIKRELPLRMGSRRNGKYKSIIGKSNSIEKDL